MREVGNEIGEVVEVIAHFAPRRLSVKYFAWQGRTYRVSSMNLFHIERDGANKFYHFAVSSHGNSYELVFNPTTLEWKLASVIQA